MKMEAWELSATVREGYQILLRAQARADLPVEYARIALYYRTLGEKCLAWATEVEGERLKREFAALESIREKSGFGCRSYRFDAGCVWEDGEGDLIAFVCESTLSGMRQMPEKRYHRSAQVWSRKEELILPKEEVAALFSPQGKRALKGVYVDGIYPRGDRLLFFRNPTETEPFSAWETERCGENPS